MTRRVLFQILAAQPQPQKFNGNPPRCPVCQTVMPSDFPAYQPVVVTANGATAILLNVRQCICGQCGVVFVVSA